MKRLLPILLLGVLPSFAHAWWDETWSYRLPITLDTSPKTGSAVAENQANVPVLLRLHAGNFQDFFSLQENLHDLRFMSGDDKIPLNFQVEQFDLANQIMLVWVMLPALNGGVATDKIYMYYGNAKATPGERPEGLYGPAQTLVVHFNEQDGQLVDASANKLPLSLRSGEIIPAGIIGKAANFKAESQLLVKNTGSMGINTTKGTTFSAWIKPAAENVASRVMSLAASSGEINLIIDGNNLLVQSGGQKIAAPASLVSNQWQHLAWVAKNGELSLYVNGESVASKSR